MEKNRTNYIDANSIDEIYLFVHSKRSNSFTSRDTKANKEVKSFCVQDDQVAQPFSDFNVGRTNASSFLSLFRFQRVRKCHGHSTSWLLRLQN